MKSKMKVKDGDAVECVPTSQRFEIVSREAIAVGKTNPRTNFDQKYLAELAESIRAQGILQPLLVRPLPEYELKEPDMVTNTWRIVKVVNSLAEIIQEFTNNKTGEAAARKMLAEHSDARFELVCGECRYRASGLAGLTSVPVVIQDLSDKAVLAVQLIENDQRKDLNVMERARGYDRLRKDLGYTEEYIIKATGKGRSTVYEILSLLKAGQKLQEAIGNGSIPETVGRLLAKIPGEKNQEKALGEVLVGGDWHHDENFKVVNSPMSHRKAAEYIRNNYMTDLKQAKFDTEDADYPNDKPGRFGVFSPQLPSCAQCPARSGNCKEEFPEIKSPNVCTNPECFQLKEKLHLERIVAKAKESGAQAVLTGKEAQRAFDYNDEPCVERGFVNRETVLPGLKKSVGELLKGKLPSPVVAIRDGKQDKLYKRDQVETLLKEAGHHPKPARSRQGELTYAAEEKQRAARTKKNEAIAEEAFSLVLAAAEKKLTTLEYLRIQAMSASWHHYAERHQIEQKEMDKRIPKMTEAELRLAIYEALLCDNLTNWDGEFHPGLKQECERWGVDLKKVGNELKREWAEANKLPKEEEQFTVAAERLEDTGDIGRSASAGDIVEGKIQLPFVFREREWVCTGGVGSGAEGVVMRDAWQVVPREDYKGKTKHYDHSGGSYEGIKVKCTKNKKEYVLTKPNIIFVPEKKGKPAKTTKQSEKGKKK